MADYTSAEAQQSALVSRDPLAAALSHDIGRFHSDYAEHRQAQGRLQAHLAMLAVETAHRNGSAITRATWVLTWATIVLAVATVVLVVATLAH